MGDSGPGLQEQGSSAVGSFGAVGLQEQTRRDCEVTQGHERAAWVMCQRAVLLALSISFHFSALLPPLGSECFSPRVFVLKLLGLHHRKGLKDRSTLPWTILWLRGALGAQKDQRKKGSRIY